ncbi:hypothetical protein BDN72DRAFT_800890 [Pluteus cervinus]|uniref:Uncharacterized protein n=1 Tax=Pluteus cervinus TaxID=181527 RepID=A0ACD3AIY2_9AGAR|nr:hypothetical protein BDN72DRAFT_800890 [Pluteus cervinus]
MTLRESMSVQNMEEAASVASEFIYSIDNLPGEIAYLLQEIKVRDMECQTIQQQIDKDAAKYIRHTLKGSVPLTPTSNGFGSTTNTSSSSSSSVSTPSVNGNAPAPTSSPNNANGAPPLAAQITGAYNRLNELSDEKCLLSERIIDIVLKTRARLDFDLAKVRLLQGEPALANGSVLALDLNNPFSPSTPVYGAPTGSGSFGNTPNAGGAYSVDGMPGLKTAHQLSESLRNALGAGSAVSTPGVAGTSASGAASPAPTPTAASTKRRRTGVATSLKITTPSPSPSSNKKRSSSPHVTAAAIPSLAANGVGGAARSRLSRQVHPPAHTVSDMDAEGEEEEEPEVEAEPGEVEEGEEAGEDDAEDESLYCFCQKQSYGDMIACDNEGGCPYEWFHLSCVGLKLPTPEKWYCSVCAPKMTASTRKSRKK